MNVEQSDHISNLHKLSASTHKTKQTTQGIFPRLFHDQIIDALRVSVQTLRVRKQAEKTINGDFS